MAVLWIIFLSLDIILMGGVCYFLTRGKKTKPAVENAPSADSLQKAQQNTVAQSLLAELKDELANVKRTAGYLERKQAQFEVFERSLHEKNAKLEELIGKAEESAGKMELTSTGRVPEETYSKAIKMLSVGTPLEDVVRNLGILNGEAELLSSLNAYRQ